MQYATMNELTREVKPLYGALYKRAHAITGSDREAEDALRQAIVACAQEEFADDFGARLTAKVTQLALASAARMGVGDEWDDTFDCFTGDGGDALSRALSREDDRVKRLAVLFYGCRLNARQIAAAAHMDVKKVKRALETLERGLARADAKKESTRAHLREACIKELSNEPYAPDFNSMMRAIEVEFTQAPPPHTRAGRAVSWAFAVASLLLLAVMLWTGVLLLNYYRNLRLEEQGTRAAYVSIVKAEKNRCPYLKAG